MKGKVPITYISAFYIQIVPSSSVLLEDKDKHVEMVVLFEYLGSIISKNCSLNHDTCIDEQAKKQDLMQTPWAAYCVVQKEADIKNKLFLF